MINRPNDMKPVIKTIYEDTDLIIIEKPANLRVDHDPNGEDSIEDMLDYPVERHGIVHRLDKETSGLLLVAKTTPALDHLKQQFKEHTITKIYTTLVLGETPKRGEIRSFIVRDPKRKQAMKSITYATGNERGKLREAISRYEKIKVYRFDNQTISLLKVTIETGRTHQIRVHFQSINHPLIGDSMYQSKISYKLSQKLNLKRQFLHAQELTIRHPRLRKEMKFTSNLPPDLLETLNQLSNIDETATT